MSDGSQAGFRFLGVGLEFAVAVVGLTLAGFWLDGRLGSSPWGLFIGLFLGLVVSTYTLIRSVRAAARPLETQPSETKSSVDGDEG